jgi:hypothetical protein
VTYRCVACCSPLIGLFKCIFEGIMNIFWAIFRFCRENSRRENDFMTSPSRKENIPMSSPSNQSHIVWELECIGSRLVLYSELQSGMIYFNSELNVVENQDGYVLKGILPPIDVINRYW